LIKIEAVTEGMNPFQGGSMGLETFAFKAEVKQLLELMIHSLYSHREIFLRELISNASDAIDRARYESLTRGEVLEGKRDFVIRIDVDAEAGTLTVSDNGLGMTREEVMEELGTIARSGTKEFLNAMKEKDIAGDPELIGQFGVGFYSSFMVSDRVVVVTRRAGGKPEEGVRWESTAGGDYSVEDVRKQDKGTDVILHLKEDCKKYLEEREIRSIVKKYSDYIEHPVVMDVEREEEKEGKKVKVRNPETLNSMKAIWLRNRSEVSPEEYNEFYRHISHDFGDPAKVIHLKAEGTSEFTALLFVPSMAPFGIFYKDFNVGPMLYVKRVQIMGNCEELVPPYLRFIKGVVDSSDLPLNISREMLQSNRQVEVIRKNIVKKVLDALSEMKNDEYEKYVRFHKEMGRVLKEGIHYDFKRREAIADLLLFESTTTEPESYTTLGKYIEGMKEGQEEIYFITGATRQEALKSPYLEAFREKGYEVLVMVEEIDDIIISGLHEFRGKRFRSVTKGDIELDREGEAEREEAKRKYEKLVELIREELKDKVKDVRLSGRLKDSACCLVAEEGDLDPKMEQVLKSMGQDVPAGSRILELNPSHPAIEAMDAVFKRDSDNPLLQEYAGLLYDQALLMVGSRPEDPAAFARSVSRLMAEKAESITD
jgi:molecular chaperone HtpG